MAAFECSDLDSGDDFLWMLFNKERRSFGARRSVPAEIDLPLSMSFLVIGCCYVYSAFYVCFCFVLVSCLGKCSYYIFAKCLSFMITSSFFSVAPGQCSRHRRVLVSTLRTKISQIFLLFRGAPLNRFSFFFSAVKIGHLDIFLQCI